MSTYTCPDCGSDKVTSEHHQAFFVNTMDHWCHTMKTHDNNSPSSCHEKHCQWKGFFEELIEVKGR